MFIAASIALLFGAICGAGIAGLFALFPFASIMIFCFAYDLVIPTRVSLVHLHEKVVRMKLDDFAQESSPPPANTATASLRLPGSRFQITVGDEANLEMLPNVGHRAH